MEVVRVRETSLTIHALLNRELCIDQGTAAGHQAF